MNSDNTNDKEIMIDKFVRWIEALDQDQLDFYGAYSNLSLDEQILNLTRGYIIGKSQKYEKLFELQLKIKNGLGY
tara:strand:- start:3 stop:227 length:225 start_codon:yes stop_codon:yes gene_type:complete